MSARLVRPLAIACALAFVLASTATAVDVSGTACKNGKCCSGKFLFDTGASESFLSRACATKMGLLADGDGNGSPDLSNGSKTFNGNIQTWCFPSVAIAATSSAGQVCVSTETVYVMKDATLALSKRNILGRPWQSDVDACYRARTQGTSWPWPNATVVGSAELNTLIDLYGHERAVVDIYLEGSYGSSYLSMTFSSDLPYAVVPASVAAGLGPVVYSVDLSIDNPDMLERLEAAEMNPTGQTVFDVIALDTFDLDVGPTGYPVNVLVSNDANSNVGILTDYMLLGTDGIHELVYAPTASEFGQIQYVQIDCDADGMPDNEQVELYPAEDLNDNGIPDSCEQPVGATCFSDGSCYEMGPSQATMGGGVYQGNGSSCADVMCPIVQKEPVEGEPLGRPSNDR